MERTVKREPDPKLYSSSAADAPPPMPGHLLDPEVVVGPKVHVLKTWPDQFRRIADGTQTFDWRFDDRNYAVGDTLIHLEFEACPRCRGEGRQEHSFQFGSCCQAPYGKYSGREERRAVLLVMRDEFGIPEGYVVMSLGPAAPAEG